MMSQYTFYYEANKVCSVIGDAITFNGDTICVLKGSDIVAKFNSSYSFTTAKLIQ